ncbi:hypothetical protein VTN00DRAFT_3255 [Thermoascus crustaceus]|uniref:uncharacterized protein n=1 Tax=Thermoascus crustaceus TaxID=5088 RepID=UPI003743D134
MKASKNRGNSDDTFDSSEDGSGSSASEARAARRYRRRVRISKIHDEFARVAASGLGKGLKGVLDKFRTEMEEGHRSIQVELRRMRAEQIALQAEVRHLTTEVERLMGRVNDLILEQVVGGQRERLSRGIINYVYNKVAIVLESKSKIIREKYELDGDWPGDQNTILLVRNACGLLIWAETACRFIDGGGRLLVEERLSQVLKEGTPMARSSVSEAEMRLAELYTTVLESSVTGKYNGREEKIYAMSKEVLGSIVILFSPLPADSLANLLHASKRDFEQTLEGLHAILNIPPPKQDRPIRVHHDSFRDFLLTK